MGEIMRRKVFISYAHEDNTQFSDLCRHLGPLKKEGLIEEWTDRMIKSGQDWSREINQAIDQADIFLLLISSHFNDSDYCQGVEMKRALERYAEGEVEIIPIIIKSCDWENMPYAKFQSLPGPDTDSNQVEFKPVVKWEDNETAWTTVAKRLRDKIQDLNKKVQNNPLDKYGRRVAIADAEEISGANLYLLEDGFKGREKELSELGAWLREGAERMLCISDLGGTGKSALVWNWFNSKQTLHYLAENGFRRFWVTFYARNFDSGKCLEALAQQLGIPTVIGSDAESVMSTLADRIKDRLSKERWLLVFDGLEREMGAFANPEHYQVDSEEQDSRNERKEILNEDCYIRGHIFPTLLTDLSRTENRIVITTRIFPANFRGMPSIREYPFGPMSDEDIERIWLLACQEVKRDRDLLGEFFRKVDYHPQVVLAVAAAVEESGQSFSKWFNRFPPEDRQQCLAEDCLKTTRRHRWMDLATQDLIKAERRDPWLTLCYIVRHSEASQIESLEKNLVESDAEGQTRLGHFVSLTALIKTLEYLKKRRLIGISADATLVDVHPVVRGQVMSYILRQYRAGGEKDKELLEHIESSDMTDLIQRFIAMPDFDQYAAGLERVVDGVGDVPHGRSLRLNLLQRVYPSPPTPGDRPWLTALPLPRLRREQARVLEMTANELMARSNATDWIHSERIFQRAITAYQLCGDSERVESCHRQFAWQSLYSGDLFESEKRILGDLRNPKDDNAPYWLALMLSIRSRESWVQDMLELLEKRRSDRWSLQTLAECWLYLDRYDKAIELAERALALRDKERAVVGQLLWERVTLGLALLRKGDGDEALEHLNFALDRGTGWVYNIIAMFALAGLVEKIRLDACGSESALERGQIGLYLKRYEGADPHGKFQIPAAEVKLALARSYIDSQEWTSAINVLSETITIARGKRAGFEYKSAFRRIARLKKEFPVLAPVDLQTELPDMEVLDHDSELTGWWNNWRNDNEK